MLGARLIAPFYGTTLFVWSTVIGVTLAALAMGYFLGGYLSERFARAQTLFLVLAIGSIMIAFMPISARWILEVTLPLGVRMGSVLSALVFLLPPLACLGTTSPIIIRLAAQTVEQSGRVAGTVYCTSTVSGIFSTFLLGFYLIPAFGIALPCYGTALSLAVLPLWFFFTQRQVRLTTTIVLLLGIIAFVLFSSHRPTTVNGLTLRARSEGLLGQVLVLDAHSTVDPVFPERRLLVINSQMQTMTIKNSTTSLLHYSHALSVAASIKPKGSKTLLLGLGGGVVANEFLQLGFEVDAVELDERMVEAARQYFYLSDKCHIIVDDARHYLNTCTPQYDVIVMDVHTGENFPPHLLTKESLAQVQRSLKPDGLFLMNFTGFITGEEGLAARSVLKTLLYAGFDVQLLPTPGEEAMRNLLFFASMQKQDYATLVRPERVNACCVKTMHVPIPLPLHPSNSVNVEDGYLLTDERPMIDMLNMQAGERWRKNVLNNPNLESLKKLLDY